MMLWINRITTKYGSPFLIILGILFVLIGLIIDLKNVETFHYYDHRSKVTNSGSPVYFSYLVGAFLILCGIKNKWIFRKKKKVKGGKTKLFKLKSEKVTRVKRRITKKENKVISLDNEITLRINKD